MQKFSSIFLGSIAVVVLLTGAGCASKGSNVPNVKTDNPPLENTSNSNGSALDDLNKNITDRFYISTDPEVCKFKSTPDTCAAAGAKFFSDDKGCGCLTGN
jgi:hypothetical protein